MTQNEALHLSPLAQSITGIYTALTPRVGGTVRLSEIHRYLGGRHEQADVDSALEELADTDGVQMWAEEDQAGLTDQDRAAAFHLGGQDRHNLAIEWVDLEG